MRWKVTLIVVLLAGCSRGALPPAPRTTAQGKVPEQTGTVIERGPVATPLPPQVAPGAPPTTVAGRVAGGPPEFAPSPFPGYYPSGTPGLSVFHTEQVTRPADEAEIYAVKSYDPSRARITEDERRRIAEELSTLEIRESDVEYPSASYGGPPGSTVLVNVGLDRLPGISDDVLDRIEKVLGTVEQSGLRYSIRDCDGALSDARKSGLAKARTKAEALGRAASVSPGATVAISDQGGDTCTSDQPGVVRGAAAEFGAREVRFGIALSVTYALPDAKPAGNGLSSWGSGSARGRADGAEIVVFVYPGSGAPGPQPTPDAGISEDARERVIRRIAEIGIERSGIRIDAPPYSGIRVGARVPIESVADLGDRVLDAVEDELGPASSSGVRYTQSNCEEIERAAREEALTAARKRASALASAAGLTLGPIQSLSESGPYSAYGYGSSPCDPEPEPYEYAVVPFDSPPEVEVNTSVSIVYALA